MGLKLDDATRSWDALTRHLEGFIASWEEMGQPPCLADHLPTDDDLRPLVLVELIKIDLEYRAQGKATPKRIEQYADEYPELVVDGRLPGDLIYEEYHVRKSAGEDVQPEEYFDRFPQNTEELRRLMPIDFPEVSTALFHADRPIADLQPGMKVDDFELILQLGKGAFASVYLARQTSMQRLVALKVSADHGSEPQTLAQLDHANIVRVYDQRPLPERKLRLLYMQYVAGGTLLAVVDRVRRVPTIARTGQVMLNAIDEEIQRGGHVSVPDTTARRRLAAAPWPEAVCRLGAQLASALDYAHEQGVLHRDIKPANVLISADGTPKLADFNISFSSKLSGATPAAYFGGSLAYMSPEQLEACNPAHERQPVDLDGRSDIYSLGVLLWELLYGQRPFQDDQIQGGWTTTLEKMVERRRNGVSDSALPQSADTLTSHVRDVLLKCLAPDREQRYPSAEMLARDLLLCLQPRTQGLLQLPSHGWRGLVRQWPVTAILAAALAPNILAGIFNYFYNRNAIIEFLQGVEPTFWNVQLVINAIAFPAGALLAWYVAWPVVRQMLRAKGPSSLTVPADVKIRAKSLALGHYAAIIGIVEWLIAGVAYPVSLHALGGPLSASHYVHFATSLAICGFIAAAYPFYFVTFLSVRVFYPSLLQNALPDDGDEPALAYVGRRTGTYLLLAGGVPILGVILLAVSSLFAQATNTTALLALLVLSVVGGLGLVLAFVMYREIHRDLVALLTAASPIDSFGTTSERLSTIA